MFNPARKMTKEQALLSQACGHTRLLYLEAIQSHQDYNPKKNQILRRGAALHNTSHNLLTHMFMCNTSMDVRACMLVWFL